MMKDGLVEKPNKDYTCNCFALISKNRLLESSSRIAKDLIGILLIFFLSPSVPVGEQGASEGRPPALEGGHGQDWQRGGHGGGPQGLFF